MDFLNGDTIHVTPAKPKSIDEQGHVIKVVVEVFSETVKAGK